MAAKDFILFIINDLFQIHSLFNFALERARVTHWFQAAESVNRSLQTSNYNFTAKICSHYVIANDLQNIPISLIRISQKLNKNLKTQKYCSDNNLTMKCLRKLFILLIYSFGEAISMRIVSLVLSSDVYREFARSENEYMCICRLRFIWIKDSGNEKKIQILCVKLSERKINRKNRGF